MPGWSWVTEIWLSDAWAGWQCTAFNRVFSGFEVRVASGHTNWCYEINLMGWCEKNWTTVYASFKMDNSGVWMIHRSRSYTAKLWLMWVQKWDCISPSQSVFRIWQKCMNFKVWSFYNSKSLQALSINWKPFSHTFKELPNDTKYIAVWLISRLLFLWKSLIFFLMVVSPSIAEAWASTFDLNPL